MDRHRRGPARRPGPKGRPGATLLAVGLALALLAAGGCDGSGRSLSARRATPAATLPPGPSCIRPDHGGGCLPLAPAGKRVDLARPRFSNPTSITNPLHPSSTIAQVIYGGQVDGRPFRTELTRLPDPKAVTWDGQQVRTVVLQYLAYSDGRIEEVALDRFAQADDGSVWYFGEDVFNYRDGVVADTEGSWLAGRDGPPAMIMPANPKVGDAYRPENIPGLVFEEVTVKAVGQTVRGPSGTVGGALTTGELHMDGTREDKLFAPGYGEFSTGAPNGDLEEVSLAVPTDARPGPLPDRLTTLRTAVQEAFDAVGGNHWADASTAVGAVRHAWDAYRSGGLPELLERQMGRDIDALAATVAGRRPPAARRAALRVAQNGLDLTLRHQPVVTVDLARLELWARQLRVDAAAADPGAVAGDVATLRWTRDRVRHTLDAAAAGRLDAQLRTLRAAADDKDLAAAAETAPALLKTVAGLQPG